MIPGLLSRVLGEAVTRALVAVLRESARLSGGGRLQEHQQQLASWTKDAQGRDVPELALNLWLIIEAFLQLLASGIGALVLVSATAVLLSGFSLKVGKMDFWFTAAIVIMQTARVVGYISGPTGRFFVQVPAASMRRVIWTRLGHRTGFVELVTVVPVLLFVAPIFAATACMILPILGLSFIDEHDYGGSENKFRKGDVKPALIFFYSLVLTQGILLLQWFNVAVVRSELTANLSSIYFAHMYRDGKELVERYVTHTQDKCIEKGVFNTTNRTLVSFAAELLQSEHRGDHASAVSVLHVLITREDRVAGAVEQICSSEQVVGSLVKLLRSNSTVVVDPNTKAFAAEIVAKLACNLRLADVPGAAHSISSLLDPRLMKTAAQTRRNCPIRENQIKIDTEGEANDGKPLIVHGLAILCELANDPGNCTEICNTKNLVPKIMAPVSRGLLMSIGDDPRTVEIVKASLRVVAKLGSCGTGESIAKLRRDLSENVRTAENILWIMRNSSDQEMRVLAVEILATLPLGEPRTREFISEMRGLLFDSDQHSSLRISAGKALNAALAIDDYASCQVLVTLMNDGRNPKEHRAVAAELLAQMCAKSTDQDRNRLSSVSNSLHRYVHVLKAIFVETTNMAELDRRKFLASFLGLAVQMREKLTTEEDFANTIAEFPVHGISMGLKVIIEMSNDSKDELCLVIMKAATKLATWIMRINPSYIQCFRDENIVVQTLKATAEAMGDLERFVILTGGADEMEPYETLQTLVETARNLITPEVEQHRRANYS